jgi:signal transduction histidine kinase/CheY-like chemotaxis protein
MNIFKKVISGIFKKPEIPDDIIEYCINETSLQNRTRLLYSAPIVIAAITAITAGYIFNAVENGMEIILLYHILINAAYLSLILCCFLFMRIHPSLREERFIYILHIVFYLSMLWASVLCVLDHNIMNLTMGFFLFSIVFAISPIAFLYVEISILLPLFFMLSISGMKGLALFENCIKLGFVGVFSGYLSFKVYYSTMESIANKKLVEMETEAARDALLHFETVWNSVECGIVIINARTKEILDINPVAVRMFGGERAFIIGKCCHEIFCPADKHSCPIIDFNQEVDRSERVFLNNKREKIPIIKSVIKITYKGQPALLECFTDISNLKKAEEQLRIMSIAEKANQAKSDFLSRMSHEMRTPMNAIIGMTKIAEKTEDVSRLKYCLSTINTSSVHLLGIINDVLDMSKIEAGKFELEKIPMNIEKMIMKVSNIIIDNIEKKKQKLNVNVAKNLEMNYIADDLRLSQVITNLLANAIKFTPEKGEITLVVERIRSKENFNTLRFSVNDTGIGMTKEQAARLFNAFEQADGSISRKFGGTGLGLAISKNIVEKMGGRIWVESKEGAGSSFIFEVDLERAPEQEAAAQESPEIKDDTAAEVPDLSGVNIILAEDMEINREIFISLLEDTNITINSAENGLVAVSKFRENPEKYDLIIMDVQMPEMDGYQATRTIRAMDTPKAKNIPIIAMTANAFKEDVDRCLAAGMNDHLAKPIDEKTVLEKIMRYSGRSSGYIREPVSPKLKPEPLPAG